MKVKVKMKVKMSVEEWQIVDFRLVVESQISNLKSQV